MPSQAAGHRSWSHWEVHRGAGRQLFAYTVGNRVKTGGEPLVRTRPFIDYCIIGFILFGNHRIHYSATGIV